MEKRTPLYDFHVEHGGKMVPFAGYLLPVQYATGVMAEHNAVRKACGLFDVSHMGEIRFRGKDALANIQRLCTNDFIGMEVGRVRYSPICNENGGIVDDLVVYKFAEDDYLLVVNAANREKDYAWFREHQFGDCQVTDESDNFAQLALQGPNAPALLAELTVGQELPTKYYTFVDGVEVSGVRCLVSRTGYTGELGYELYCAPEQAVTLANAILKAGEAHGLLLCGLGARDTLRLEAAMPLYGHEMTDDISPLAANLGFFVKMEKEDFIGKDALEASGESKQTRVGLEIKDRGIAREHCPVYHGGAVVGEVTSGTMGPYVGKAIAMAMVNRDVAEVGQELEVDVRGRRLKAEVVPLPFYKRATTK